MKSAPCLRWASRITFIFYHFYDQQTGHLLCLSIIKIITTELVIITDTTFANVGLLSRVIWKVTKSRGENIIKHSRGEMACFRNCWSFRKLFERRIICISVIGWFVRRSVFNYSDFDNSNNCDVFDFTFHNKDQRKRPKIIKLCNLILHRYGWNQTMYRLVILYKKN